MPLWQLIQKTTFPGVQGTPYLNHIAAKAIFFGETLSDEYRMRQFRIVENAKRLAADLASLGYDVLTGGTDNHMILVDVSRFRAALTGVIAQKCLEECGIIINMNKLPYDTRPPVVTSGMRLGTPIVTRNGMGEKEIDEIAQMVDQVLRQVKPISDTRYSLDRAFAAQKQEQVKHLCSRFPMH